MIEFYRLLNARGLIRSAGHNVAGGLARSGVIADFNDFSDTFLSLAAIAPLSLVSDTGRGTLYPGGILNNGFATDWAEDRQHDSRPGGQAWSQKRLDDGDPVCIENMKLRGQTPDILQMIADNAYYIPEVADPVSPVTFVHNITVRALTADV